MSGPSKSVGWNSALISNLPSQSEPTAAATELSLAGVALPQMTSSMTPWFSAATISLIISGGVNVSVTPPPSPALLTMSRIAVSASVIGSSRKTAS